MYLLNNKIDVFKGKTALALAPMAGITDKPFRQLAKQFGADWTVSEMIIDAPSLQNTRKTLNRQNHEGESGAIVVQIAGSDPEQLAAAARWNVDLGAQVIDINMGCPAKKVCNILAGSALLQNEPLVERILNTVVQAVDVPVTLKTRLGWDDEHKNVLTIAKMAEQAGIAALAVHGRTRTQMYRGEASYSLIAEVKQSVSIPVWANGDIISPQKAAAVLRETGADGLMIGRGAQGQPWLFADIRHYLAHGKIPPVLRFQAAADTALAHLAAIHAFYGDLAGTRIARKHIGWYLQQLPESETFRKQINQVENAAEQYDKLAEFFRMQAEQHEFWLRDYS
ncbi:tRNA dihydrouridine synthase DusB [Kingella negevensis]|uniref:tRNA-dihydrouridine synthase B n=1 Tax=Kingella negevensis TaxID=1522312 RepID=A0A238HIN1_9NEIS|nr:tRNA dihydrouridine synthase DusB [Kingella negevensis]MDK4680373.1 tRNA dihydrouridine synthase DusB [Kingella negevensis]MDK4681905.1 tRNA dihydrouridine synthase DusB [Kingella negevensis]MDK4690102.1 tRNA dihydrouridine synthase DusB [Kingella negevensis]MDK4692552.1 tRNA dihydrouridine synthase DusB [Kingella negevensis]MDK4698024.1 tRNA dihydrouridine synthase DusB [Kingella negevensis]